jgi:leader peptidase (prepilin peptidase) / N-methyltransferase
MAARIVVALLAGLAVGSFLTVVVHRLPRRASLVAPRSRCPHCGTPVRPRDNIPVVSWLLLRGRCRSCGARISPSYPLTELATAALFVSAVVVFEDLFVAVLMGLFLGLMLAVALIDARWRIVPNRLVYPSLVAFGAAIAVGDLAGVPVGVLTAAIGMAAYSVPLLVTALLVPGGMGMGDVKLAAVIGLVLGSLSLAHVAVAAGVGVVAGGVGALTALVILGYGRRQQIPFGPFMAGGAVVAALATAPIKDLYLSLTGLG